MKKFYTIIAFTIFCVQIQSQVPIILKDIFVGGNSNPSNFIELNGKTYFSAFSSIAGTELFVSDGTENGTYVLKDIASGINSSSPGNFIVFKSKLYFTANDITNGIELWVTDGTPLGTVLLKNINPIGSSFPNNLTIYNNSLYFVANDGTNGSELWMTDGTPLGTVLLKDINPGILSANPSQMYVYNNKLYFYATNNTSGGELWQTDGTALGTILFKDIRVGVNSSNVNSCYEYNGSMYFSADNGINGPELWVSDGTSAGTVLFMDIQAGAMGSSPIRFNTIQGKLFFIALTTATGSEPWISDGTVGGTQLLKDIRLGPLGSTNPVSFVFNNKLFFGADNGINGNELWSTDGTAANTQMFKDAYPGTLGFNPNAYVIYNSDMLFIGQTGIGTDLYKLTPAMDSIYYIAPFSTFPINSNGHITQNLKVCNNMCFYSGAYTSEGSEPYVINNFPKVLATNTFNPFYTFIDSTSSVQSISVSGLNLLDSVKITATSNFEISTSANSGYTNSIVLLKDSKNQVGSNLYLRFKPTYKGSVNGDLKFITGGIDSPIYFSILGFGIDFPSVSSVGHLDTFKTYLDSTSDEQFININASHLNEDVIVISNGPFLISTNIDTGYRDSIILAKNFNSTVNSKIYVRYHPIKKGIDHSNIEITTLGASSLMVPLIGKTLTKPYIKIQNWFNDTFFSQIDQYASIKKFEIEGDDLQSEISLIASAHFELSNDSNDFANSIKLTPEMNKLKITKLFVRFKSNAAGFYNGTLKIFATNVDTQTYIMKGMTYKKSGIDKLGNMTYSVFPNPFVDQLNIAFKQDEMQGIKMAIFDFQGNEMKMVKRVENRENITISTDDFSSGVYFLHIKNESFQRVIKLVKY